MSLSHKRLYHLFTMFVNRGKFPVFGYIRRHPMNTTAPTHHHRRFRPRRSQGRRTALCHRPAAGHPARAGRRRLPLCRTGRPRRRGREDAGAHQVARHPARLHRRLDLPVGERLLAGDRATTPKGRKQYRYHPRWRETRDETKYEHMMAFGEALPQHPRAGRARPGPARPAAREGAGDGRAPAGNDADPGRQQSSTPRRTSTTA